MPTLKSPDSFKYVNLYFQVHQPKRLRRFLFSEIGSDISYFDDKLNAAIIKRIADECYIPANRLLMEVIEKFPQVKLTFSISGCALDQLTEYAPQAIKSFQELAATGSVEFLGETYFHSLAYLIDKTEFADQVNRHRKTIKDLFGVRPTIFRNTDLVYSNSIGQTVFDMGFKGAYIDGVEKGLNGRTSDGVYKHPTCNLALFPRDYRLSDDIAFRFSDRNWKEWPLTANKFASWLQAKTANEKFIALGLGYETFGEHKKASEGIFDFLRNLISRIAEAPDMRFIKLSEAGELLQPLGVISTEKMTSWADDEKDLSAWLGCEIQRIAFDALSKLYPMVKNSSNSKLMKEYRYLQCSDHFYYMSTKENQAGAVHDSVNHYHSSYEAFKNYLNIVNDLEVQVKNAAKKRIESVDYEVRGKERVRRPALLTL
jgi:alpha-amylase